MKKLAIFLSAISFSENIFVSMSPLSPLSPLRQDERNQDTTTLDDVLRRQGYTSEQIKIWKKLYQITEKEKQGIRLSASEQILADLEDGK